jgi:ATP-dependent RNA helicase DDX19/DBP5
MSDIDGIKSEENKENTANSTNEEKGVETADADASLLRKLLRNKLDETNVDIEVERRDPKSPLYSAKTFEELNLSPQLLRGIYAMGFTRPSKIQETVLPALLDAHGSNLIAQSQSGTGKTAAFVLTMLSKVDIAKEYPQAVCLAPTHELAAQIYDVASKMGQFMDGLNISLAIKGQMVQRKVPIKPHIVIGTPGTVLDWSNVGRFQVFDLSKVVAFVHSEK